MKGKATDAGWPKEEEEEEREREEPCAPDKKAEAPLPHARHLHPVRGGYCGCICFCTCGMATATSSPLRWGMGGCGGGGKARR